MKIAFCLYKYFPYGGLQNYFLKIWEECRRRGHETQVFAREWEGAKPEDLNLNLISVRALTNSGKNINFVKKLRPILEKENFNVIVGFNKIPGLDVYVQADVCYRAHYKNQKIKFLIGPKRYRHFFNYEAAVFGSSSPTHILLLSEGEMRKFIKYYGTCEKRFTLLPPPCDKNRLPPPNLNETRKHLRKLWKIKDNEHLILFVGSNFKSKGLNRLLRGFQSLPERIRRNSYVYVIGKDRSTRRQISARFLGFSPRIKFLGARSNLLDFYLAGDLLVHPASLENTGTVIFEAVTAGLPVLATENCGYSTYIEKSRAGKIIPSPYSQKEFVGLLMEMITSPERSTWSKNGLEFGTRLPAQQMHEKAMDVIEEIAIRKAKTENKPS